MQRPLARVLSILLLVGMAVGVVGAPSPTKAATMNSLIKGSGQTLYWYATDGKRYVFPNIQTYYSWFSSDDLRRVNTLSDLELGNITIGGNVTYRGGYRLVKVTTDPKVYAVSRYGTLRWVTSEAVASQLYGSGWRWQIDDIPDMFFTNYTIGAPIYSSSDYNVSNEYNGVSTPSDNIRIVAPLVPPVLGRLTESAAISGAITDRSWSGSNETVTYVASLSGVNGIEAMTIRLYNQTTGEFLRSCTSKTSCSTTLTSSIARTDTLYATASDSFRTISSGTITVSYGGTIPLRPIPDFRVTNVVSSLDTSRANACNLGFGVIGTITANRAGTVAYQWERSDNAIPPVEYVTFTAAGTKTVSGSWFLSGNYTGWLRLKVISPNEIRSNQTAIISNCITPPAQHVIAVASSVSPSQSATCAQRFTFTGMITADRAGVVRYTWDRSDGAIDTLDRSITFTGPGSLNVTDTWDMSATYTGWEQLRILSPNATVSPRATFSLSCSSEPFRVTSARVVVDQASASVCRYHQFNFTGSITANRAGTVRYRWERSDGGQSSEDQYATFTGAGTQTVTNSWNFSGNYPYSWVRLHILSPEDTFSNNAEISLTQTCRS